DGNRNETIRVMLNGYEITPTYAGRQPDCPGLDQINVEIPRSFLGYDQLAVRVVAAGQPAALASTDSQVRGADVSNTTEVSLVVPPAAQAEWRQSGLEGQEVHDFAESERVIAAGASEGVFRSVNDGLSWIHSPYSFPTIDSVRAAFVLLKGSDGGFIVGT